MTNRLKEAAAAYIAAADTREVNVEDFFRSQGVKVDFIAWGGERFAHVSLIVIHDGAVGLCVPRVRQAFGPEGSWVEVPKYFDIDAQADVIGTIRGSQIQKLAVMSRRADGSWSVTEKGVIGPK